ncbi:TPR domain-containing protein [Colletotrichum lupini]|uniref:TPR domain-containing protein n=1 Tax=Colletotrichum lupini TaxID=145971 RepID=A0A9Q8SF95_9PEZI|nr:TPR domain-containing protein [Colletotrichum lupini]UQC76140.1 TPR domain-containing protein [Colletotrichum lupini]
MRSKATSSALSSYNDTAYAYNLGTFHRAVSTSSQDAQVWFNRGLTWAYAFNHEESARCFRKAIEYDPFCAMAYWGLAFVLGPNYNKPWKVFDGEDLADTTKRAHHTIMQAKSHSGKATPVEIALIDALSCRYPQEKPAEDCSKWNEDYAQAMDSVLQAYPDDLDVVALWTDATMNVTPWKLWDYRTGKPTPGARTLEIKDVMDRTFRLRGSLQHPGLLHLYIHLMEMSPTPEAALTIADNLRGLVPDAGHLEHMPTHLDIICGEYRRAIASNSDAIRADSKFLAREGPLNFYTLYRSHDFHFRLYAAMLCGQSRVALITVEELESTISEDLLRVESPPMADWLEGFLGMRMHALIRFGRWEAIHALELPRDPKLYCSTTAMTHYAKGIAYAVQGRIEEAEKQRVLFAEAVKRVPESRSVFNNTCLSILSIAEAMLDGELAYRKKDYDVAFAYLRKAVERDDALPYDEPWGWMQPARHALGALLLEQGHVEEAAAVYSADLGVDETLPRALRHPNNVWALHGFYECLMKLGRVDEAKILKPQLQLALAVADVPVKSSCFCRLKTVD